MREWSGKCEALEKVLADLGSFLSVFERTQEHFKPILNTHVAIERTYRPNLERK